VLHAGGERRGVLQLRAAGAVKGVAQLVPLLPLAKVLGREQLEQVVAHLVVAQQQAAAACAQVAGVRVYPAARRRF